MLCPSFSGSLYDQTLKAVQINLMKANELHVSDGPTSNKILRESLLVLVRLAEQLAISIDSRQIAQIMNNILGIMKKVYLGMTPLTPVVINAQSRVTVQKNSHEADRSVEFKSAPMGGVSVESRRGIDVQSVSKKSVGTLTDDLEDNENDRNLQVQREIDIFFHTRNVSSVGDIQPSNNFLNSLLQFQQGLAKDLDFLMESITDKPNKMQDDMLDQWPQMISQIEKKRNYTKQTIGNFIERLRRLFQQKMQLTQSVGCQTPKRFQLQTAIQDTRQHTIAISKLEKQLYILTETNKYQQKTIEQLTLQLSSEKETNVKNGLARQQNEKLLSKLTKLLQQRERQLTLAKAKHEQNSKAPRQLVDQETETAKTALTINQLSKMAIKIEPVRSYSRVTVASTNSTLLRGLVTDGRKMQPKHNLALLHKNEENIKEVDEDVADVKSELKSQAKSQIHSQLMSQTRSHQPGSLNSQSNSQRNEQVEDHDNMKQQDSDHQQQLSSAIVSLVCSPTSSPNNSPEVSQNNTYYSQQPMRKQVPSTNQPPHEKQKSITKQTKITATWKEQPLKKHLEQPQKTPTVEHVKQKVPPHSPQPKYQQKPTKSTKSPEISKHKFKEPPKSPKPPQPQFHENTSIVHTVANSPTKCQHLSLNQIISISIQPQCSLKQSKDTSIFMNPPSQRHLVKHPKRKSMAQASLPSIHRNNSRNRLKQNLPVLSRDLTIEATGCSPFRISPIRYANDIENLNTVNSNEHSPEKRQVKPFYSAHWSTEECQMREDSYVQEKLQSLTKNNINLHVHITADLFYQLKQFANKNSKDANNLKKFVKYVRQAHRVKCGEVCHHIRKFILKLETYALLQERIIQTLPRKYRV